MAQVGSQVTARALSLMSAEDSGINSALAELSMLSGVPVRPLTAGHLQAQNVAADIAEKSVAAKYPAVHIYAEKVTNSMREKFRTFSGKARVVAEARVSQDRLEGVEQQSGLVVDAITAVLDASRGDWGQGMFYTGGYEVSYGPVKHGGNNFLQITKVAFEVDVSAG